MGRKRKRNATLPQDDDNTERQPASDLEKPKEKGARLAMSKTELPWDLQGYWGKRHELFSMYDHGIWTTDDSWFEVTPESIANKIAQHVTAAKPDHKIFVFDCFAGIGGNAIAFALCGYKRVFAIEKNPAALECARHNAKIYGVHDQITFFLGDCFEELGLEGNGGVGHLADLVKKAGIIFASPPWGGPSYKDQDVFDLNLMPYSFEYMYSNFKKLTGDMVLYLPRTSDLNQMADCLDDGSKSQVVHYCTYGSSRTMCVYIGDWKTIQP